MVETRFSQLSQGDRARVAHFGGMPDHYRVRLLSMGLVPGIEFVVERFAPLGDPVEISLRGFRLSLRRAEAGDMRVERL